MLGTVSAKFANPIFTKTFFSKTIITNLTEEPAWPNRKSLLPG